MSRAGKRKERRVPIPITVPGLGFLDFELPEIDGITWTVDHADDPSGAPSQTFHAYGPELERDIAQLVFADGTADDTEPDIASLRSEDVPDVDAYLQRGLAEYHASEGEAILRWMGSQLNAADRMRALVTAYIKTDQGKERQVVAVRLPLHGRKVVVIGSFNVDRADILAVPIITALRQISILPAQ